MGLRNAFLQKIHDAHLALWSQNCLAGHLCIGPTEQWCQDNMPKLYFVQRKPIYAGECTQISGQGKFSWRDIWHWHRRDSWKISHCLCRLFYMQYIWERALKSTFNWCNWSLEVDVLWIRAPDKIISDNARYFPSEEFQDFTMRWSIHHITSSRRFPHGNAHAEKAIHVVKQIYMKADDVKLALLLLKMTPISNHKNVIQDAPAKLFYGWPVQSPSTCKTQTSSYTKFWWTRNFRGAHTI